MSKRYRTKHSRRTVYENECKATAKAPPELNASRSPLAKYCTTGKHTVCKKEQEIFFLGLFFCCCDPESRYITSYYRWYKVVNFPVRVCTVPYVCFVVYVVLCIVKTSSFVCGWMGYMMMDGCMDHHPPHIIISCLVCLLSQYERTRIS